MARGMPGACVVRRLAGQADHKQYCIQQAVPPATYVYHLLYCCITYTWSRNQPSHKPDPHTFHHTRERESQPGRAISKPVAVAGVDPLRFPGADVVVLCYVAGDFVFVCVRPSATAQAAV
jgi:hypothetical protein